MAYFSMNNKKAPKNDNTCGWSETIASRASNAAVVGDIKADWLVVGAGYTGLSAARSLALLHPNKHIVLIDGQKAGEGASARNSGYLVDSTLNDGHLSDTGLSAYQQKYQLNLAGLAATKLLVEQHKIQCDWSEIGKIHATATVQNEQKLQQFSETLGQLNLDHNVLSGAQLKQRLGTSYYRLAIETKGAVMLQPASLARGLIDILPENVSLFEHSPMLEWQATSINSNKTYRVKCPNGTINAKGLIFAVNGFMPAIGLQKNRVFPLTLTASLTRSLSDQEYESISSPSQWGVLSAQAMGATVRLTQDKRLMIRNTAEVWGPMSMSAANLKQRKVTHIEGLCKRFPQLPADLIEYTWSGITCISKNNANVFTQVDKNAFAAGCYNGGGIGLSILYGQQIASYASGSTNSTINMIQNRPKPERLPPQPFLNWGIALKLKMDRYFAIAER
jgi:glycine/D-amino acid oxidase-like deaminating enzyme